MHPKVGFYLPGIDSTPKKSPVGVSGEHAFLQKHPPCFSPSSVIFVELSHSTHTEPFTPQSSANWKACRGISSTVTWPPPRWTFTEALQGRESQTFLACQPALWSVVKTCGVGTARLLLSVEQKAGKEKFIQMVKLMLSLVTCGPMKSTVTLR